MSAAGHHIGDGHQVRDEVLQRFTGTGFQSNCLNEAATTAVSLS